MGTSRTASSPDIQFVTLQVNRFARNDDLVVGIAFSGQTPQVGRAAMVDKQGGQAMEDIIMAEVPRHLNGQAFPGIFIHDDKETERSPVGRAERDKVIRPDMMAVGRP